MEKSEEVVIRYSLECPECKIKIKGNSPDQVNYNMKKHIFFKHKQVKGGKKNGTNN